MAFPCRTRGEHVGRRHEGEQRVAPILRWSVAVFMCALEPMVAHAITCGERLTGAVTLTTDLSCPSGHGVRLESGAALDCAGHTITGGTEPGQYGIYLDTVDGAAISNCTVERFEVGIRLRATTDATVHDSVSQDNTRYGIELTQASTGARIWRNGVYTNGDEGIHVSGPVDGLAAHQIVENVLDGNALEGIYLLNTHGNIVAGNMIQNHGAAGIYVKGSTRNSIAENVQVNDPLQLVAGAELNVLSGNEVIGHKIKLDGASRNLVYASAVRELGGSPADAYHFVGASDNRLVDVEAVDPTDHHVRATDVSTGNVFVRMSAVPALQCLVAADSSVTVTDVDGVSIPCAASGTSTTTLQAATTTVPPTTSTTSATIATTTTVTTSTTTLPAAAVAVEVRVAASSDDAEERSSGRVQLTSSDLEMVYDKDNQLVGMRFRGLDVPPGARIARAYIQFQVDEETTGETRLFIRGQYTAAAPMFDENDGDISSRELTGAEVEWLPPAWTSVGRAGAVERTPDIAAIVQEIVQHPGWQRGNALVIIITGSGERVAESYDGKPGGAPLLHVEY